MSPIASDVSEGPPESSVPPRRLVRRVMRRALLRAARTVPSRIREKVARLLVQSLPADDLSRVEAIGAPAVSDTAILRLFAQRLAAGPDERACQLAHGAVERGLDRRSKLRLRRDLVQRVRVPHARVAIELLLGAPEELEGVERLDREPWTAGWIERYMAPAHVFYDVGANIGVFSIFAARALGAPAHVYSFEPAFMNFESLCRNVVANGCEQEVTPIPAAVSEHSGFETFNYAGLAAGSASHVLGSESDSHRHPFDASYRQRVMAWSLDQLSAEYQLPKPNHIRLGVAGTALDVLRGATEILSDPRLLTLAVKAWPERSPPREVEQLLSGFGFTCVERRTTDGASVGQPEATHLLCVREG